MADGINSNGETCILHGLELSIFTRQNPDLNNTGLLLCISGLADVRKVTKGTRSRLKLLSFPSRGAHPFYYSLLINSSHAFYFSLLYNSVNLSPKLEVLRNQIIERVLFPEQLAKRMTKIKIHSLHRHHLLHCSFNLCLPSVLTWIKRVSNNIFHDRAKCFDTPCVCCSYCICQSEWCINRCLRWAQANMWFCLWGWANYSSLLSLYPGFLLYKLINDVLKSSGKVSKQLTGVKIRS